ncbi:amidohydrolase family protein, partial [Candidatus Hydrogenedentota bacterium]
DWYKEAMGRANLSEVIRPVHPEYYLREQDPAAAAGDRELMHNVLRVDPILGMAGKEDQRRIELAKALGVSDPTDAPSWRAFLEGAFELAASGGAVGIKQLQAYSRDLDFRPVTDQDVPWGGINEGEGNREFQDWLVNECCRLATERHWPFQVHTGTHNLPNSNPLPLGKLAARHRGVKFVMLHCWPYIDETGFLAKYHPNIYIDPCWLAILNPRFLAEALDSWIEYVPSHKIMCSNDATTLEMAVGSSLITREIIDGLLKCRAKTLGLDDITCRRLAVGFLHNNAVDFYGIGTKV